jgi:hypothetical protein
MGSFPPASSPAKPYNFSVDPHIHRSIPGNVHHGRGRARTVHHLKICTKLHLHRVNPFLIWNTP